MKRIWFVLLIALFVACQVVATGCATKKADEKEPAAAGAAEEPEAPADEEPAAE